MTCRWIEPDAPSTFENMCGKPAHGSWCQEHAARIYQHGTAMNKPRSAVLADPQRVQRRLQKLGLMRKFATVVTLFDRLHAQGAAIKVLAAAPEKHYRDFLQLIAEHPGVSTEELHGWFRARGTSIGAL